MQKLEAQQTGQKHKAIGGALKTKQAPI